MRRESARCVRRGRRGRPGRPRPITISRLRPCPRTHVTRASPRRAVTSPDRVPPTSDVPTGRRPPPPPPPPFSTPRPAPATLRRTAVTTRQSLSYTSVVVFVVVRLCACVFVYVISSVCVCVCSFVAATFYAFCTIIPSAAISTHARSPFRKPGVPPPCTRRSRPPGRCGPPRFLLRGPRVAVAATCKSNAPPRSRFPSSLGTSLFPRGRRRHAASRRTPLAYHVEFLQ